MVEWKGNAIFSEEHVPLYRWRLDRFWATGKRALVCMANPSTAGATTNDPTITNLIKLTYALGYPGFTVVNLSPRIFTDPKEHSAWRSRGRVDMVLSENLHYVRRLVPTSSASIVAWGNLGPDDEDQRRMEHVLSQGGRRPLMCFGKTASGAPKHPMARGKHRIVHGTPLEAWRPSL